ncbi:MMPL family transporter [Solirubrobacter ginsenosidimutans]|uniref:MMPL family transporter n=1 Tax=Solirubrobacter ginsenosidimutans TaxID=490573 RepID=A0A9X3MQ16_9ACTN|nr:MMPL family transporter [Solirubrobacter ginsenosidimutans]MDA0159153.1 MMPL family transporter [Solirubrobacter ginsenosidimutans]
MRSLARWCFRNKFVVLAIWVAALLVLGGLSASAGSGYTDSFSLPGTESTTALNLLTDNFNTESTDTNQVVFAADDVTDPAVQARIEKTLAAIGKLPHVERVDSPFAEGAGARQIAKDKTVAFANVHMDGEQPIADVPKSAYDKLISTAEGARGDGLQVELAGNGIQQATQQPGGGPSEFIGFIAAAIVLAIAFGSLWATLLPLFTAVLALGCGLSLNGLLAHLFNIATFAPTLATLIGLGVGIDYSLFVVTRHRNAITAGRDPEAACIRALNTSGRAVLFAGATVIVALLGLLVLGVSFLNGVAVASAVVVLVTMTAAVTLIPALLGMFGMKVLSRKERRRLEAEGPRDPKLDGFWPRWAQTVQDHRLPFALAALLVMLALAVPALSLRLGSSDAGQDPAGTTTRKAYDLLAKGFGPGFNGTFQIVARTPNGKADLPKVQQLADALGKTAGLASVSPPVQSPNGKIALIEARPSTAPQDAATSRLIDTLRNDVIPKSSAGLPVYVGGITAIFDDFAGVLTDKLPLFIFVIVLLGCLLLMIAFRSLLIPLTAAVMNLLAAGAAFGVVTLVFQEGFLAGPLGVGTGPIEAFLPVMMLAILFGLSMDYQVFLVSRMHEEWMRTGDNSHSVRIGQAATGRVITAAATIMILVFGSFLLAGQRVIAEFGIGLASAVLLDAFILRTVLVPATMHLIGDRNWWLPRGLDRVLPRLAVEGAET